MDLHTGRTLRVCTVSINRWQIQIVPGGSPSVPRLSHTRTVPTYVPT